MQKVRECENLLPPESTICDQGLNNWQKEEQINGVKMTINHEKGQVIKVGDPTYTSEDIQNNDDLLDEIMKQLQSEDKAIFVVLESSGFPMYRAIKRAARKHKVPLGWEPWYGVILSISGETQVEQCQFNSTMCKPFSFRRTFVLSLLLLLPGNPSYGLEVPADLKELGNALNQAGFKVLFEQPPRKDSRSY